MDSVDENIRSKYIVVTGGNMSGLGKGTAMSSIGVLLMTKNILLTVIKIDPYLNIDAGTMSPYEHGEVYVLEDGGEVDLDLGNYERFLNVKLSFKNNITSGKIYQKVISKERRGKYLGKTVQVVPHLTDAIQKWIMDVNNENIKKMKKEYGINSYNNIPCICLIEVGGTVGDIESAVYLEALQQLTNNMNTDDVCLCHLSYVPITGNLKEQKTKPTQHSVKILREAGLKPDFIFCRCEEPLTKEAIEKISLFSQVKNEHVISLHDTSNIYKVPLILEQQYISYNILKKLNLHHIVLKNKLNISPYSFNTWQLLANRYENSKQPVVIGIVGKYTGSNDTYLSVISALVHASLECGYKLIIKYINSSHLFLNKKKKKKKKNREFRNMASNDSYNMSFENSISFHKNIFVDDTTSEKDYEEKRIKKYNNAWNILKSVDGVLVPGGFGTRGIEGKLLSSKYCRLHNIPYLGICLGMQTSVIDITREFLNMNATSEEFENVLEIQTNIHDDNVYNKKQNGFKSEYSDKIVTKEDFHRNTCCDVDSIEIDPNKIKFDTRDHQCFENEPSSHHNGVVFKNGYENKNESKNEHRDESSSNHQNNVKEHYPSNLENDNKTNIKYNEILHNSKLANDCDEYVYGSNDFILNCRNIEFIEHTDFLHNPKFMDDISKKMLDHKLLDKIQAIGIHDYYKSVKEIDSNNVIVSMEQFKGDNNKGGSMRLGVKNSKIIDKESLTYKVYDKSDDIFERHRHRYEINPKYVPLLESVGLSFVAKDIDSIRMEICEIKSLDFYIGVQFHPEFTSRPFKANPLFLAFVLASKNKLKERLNMHEGMLRSGFFYKSQ